MKADLINMAHKSNTGNAPHLTLWDRLQLARAFDLSITDPNSPVLERIARLNTYHSAPEHRYYEVEQTEKGGQTRFRITQHRTDLAHRHIRLVGSITRDSDRATHISGKIVPNLANPVAVTLLSVLLLYVLFQGYGELSAEITLAASVMTALLVIFALFQWLAVMTERLSFDHFLQSWLTTGSSAPQTADAPLEQAA